MLLLMCECITFKSVSEHVKNIRLIAQYLLTEKASVPQVLKKSSELKVVMNEDFWTVATVQDLEKHRSSLRDLMQFLVGSGKKKFEIDISDEVDEATGRRSLIILQSIWIASLSERFTIWNLSLMLIYPNLNAFCGMNSEQKLNMKKQPTSAIWQHLYVA